MPCHRRPAVRFDPLGRPQGGAHGGSIEPTMTRLLTILFLLVLAGTGMAQAVRPTLPLNGGPGAAPGVETATKPVVGSAGKTTSAAAVPATVKPKASSRSPRRLAQEPEASPEQVVIPHDLRGRSLLRLRLEVVDAAFPWLVPTAPTQWISIGLLLFVSLCLVIHLSTRVSGADGVALGRSMALASWYMVTGLVQMALVPASQFSTGVMLLANPAVALFWLCTLFGLSRGASVVAFAVQLGFVVLGYGVLELVTSLLGSIGTDIG